MGGEHTFDDIDRAATTLEAMVTSVDVALLTGPGATRLATRLVTVERVVASARSRALRRAAEANQWRHAGERSPAAWAAKTMGTTPGHAAADLETAELLESLPATRAARDSGAISGLQAREIAGAATADPTAETLLLRRAAVDDAASLRRRCAQVRAAAETDEAAARERVRRQRRLRTWVDPEGVFNFAGRGLPEDGAALLTAIRPHQDAAFTAARRTGGHEPTDAYAYDGLITLARQGLSAPPRGTRAAAAPASQQPGSGHDTSSVDPADASQPTCAHTREQPARSTRLGARDGSAAGSLSDTPAAPAEHAATAPADHAPGADDGHDPGTRCLPPLPGVKLIVRIDHTALVRGHTVPGEVCELAGIGPIPVTTARHYARDAFLTAVVTDGIDIQKVVHLGRAATAHQRTALQARGMTCAVPGCGTTTRLEIDHVDGGPSPDAPTSTSSTGSATTTTTRRPTTATGSKAHPATAPGTPPTNPRVPRLPWTAPSHAAEVPPPERNPPEVRAAGRRGGRPGVFPATPGRERDAGPHEGAWLRRVHALLTRLGGLECSFRATLRIGARLLRPRARSSRRSP